MNRRRPPLSDSFRDLSAALALRQIVSVNVILLVFGSGELVDANNYANKIAGRRRIAPDCLELAARHKEFRINDFPGVLGQPRRRWWPPGRG